MKSIEVKEEGLTEVYLEVDLPWPMKNLDCHLLFSENKRDHAINWRNIGGCIVRNTGGIELTRVNDKTLMKMSLVLQLGNMLPQRIIDWVVKNKLPKEIQLIRKGAQRRMSRGQYKDS